MIKVFEPRGADWLKVLYNHILAMMKICVHYCCLGIKVSSVTFLPLQDFALVALSLLSAKKGLELVSYSSLGYDPEVPNCSI